MGKLYINNVLIDLPTNFKFARTKQVNDIARLDNRQANYTQNIKIPRTKNNTLAFKGLGTLGSQSTLPYSVNNVRYVNESGQDEIYNGIFIIRSVDKYYNGSIYDGYISFTKAIENKVLTDTGLSDLNHLKNMSSIINTWNSNTDYKYLIGDYNGKAIFNNGLNIDYLIPSVSIKYLWDKVHEFTGFTYEGDLFNKEKFTDLYLTYPKAISKESQVVTLLDTFIWFEGILWQSTDLSNNNTYLDRFLTSNLNGSTASNSSFFGSSSPVRAGSINNSYFKFTTDTLCKIQVSGVITSGALSNVPLSYSVFANDTDLQNNNPLEYNQVINVNVNDPFDYVFYVNVKQGQSIFLVIEDYNFDSNLRLKSSSGITTKFSKVEGETVDFEEAFIEFSIKKFVDEVLTRFSLTPFIDKYTNHIKYLTTKEWLEGGNFIDWSSRNGKYINTLKESYVLSRYAQRNYFRYKYNDDNLSHNDGFINVANKNIKEEATIISSSFFSPEKQQSTLLNESYDLCKIWDKEVNDNNETNYKELDNRFYLLKKVQENKTLLLTSEASAAQQTVSSYLRESFSGLSFNDLIIDNYQPINAILNTSKVIVSEVYLNDLDVINLDFSKLVYIRERGSYYIINKIPNYISKGKYRVELLEVDLQERPLPIQPLSIVITSEAIAPVAPINNWSILTTYTFVNYYPVDGVTIQGAQLISVGGAPTGIVINDVINEAATEHSFQLTTPLTSDNCGVWEITITDSNSGTVSNSDTVNIPCPL